MKTKKKRQQRKTDGKLPIAEHFLSSLVYLYGDCSIEEIKLILKLSIDLCNFLFQLEKEGSFITKTKKIDKKNLLSSLEYLKCEASRNKLEDIEMILDATSKFCIVTQYCLLRMGHPSAYDYQFSNLPKKSIN